MIRVEIDDDVTEAVTGMMKTMLHPERPMRAFAGYLQRKWVKSFENAPRRSIQAAKEGEPPLRHSGGFARSITYNVMPGAIEEGSTDIRGEILHEGGIIRKKAGGPLLTVGLTDETYGKRAREFGDLHFVPIRGGGPSGHAKGMLVRGEGEGFKPIFALMEQVRIRKHPWAVVDDEDEAEMLRTFETGMNKEAGIR